MSAQDALRRGRQRERMALTAGIMPEEVRRQRDAEAVQRAVSFVAEQNKRPLAVQFLLQEVAEKSDTEDGRFLTQVLERLTDELRVMLIRGSTRELALVLTSIENAKHWAIEHGVKTNSHVVLDRRLYQTNHEENLV